MAKTPTDPVEQLREAIREANGVTKDLRAMIKEARTVVDQIHTAVETHLAGDLGEKIDIGVKAGLESYHETMAQACDNATDAVFQRFDTILATLLGTHRSQRGHETVPEMLRAAQIAGKLDPTIDLTGLERPLRSRP